jgi:hypothetical protein
MKKLLHRNEKKGIENKNYTAPFVKNFNKFSNKKKEIPFGISFLRYS